MPEPQSSPRPDNVAPTPDLADVPMRPVPDGDGEGAAEDQPPAADLTLPTE